MRRDVDAMSTLSVRDALGGPWAANIWVWVLLYPPTTLLVLLRETITPFPDWWWPLVSATLQHLVVGVVIVLGAGLGRRRYEILPYWLLGVIWGLAAVSRGIVGGTLAQLIGGVDPEYGVRVAAWLIASLLWIPMFVYVLAQFDYRRLLLGALDSARSDLEFARDHSAETAAQVQRRLRDSVRDTLRPVLNDFEDSLYSKHETIEEQNVADLSARLSRVHDDVAAVLDSAGRDDSLSRQPPSRASVRRSFEAQPQNPGLTALLVTIACIALVMPDAWRLFGPLAAAEVSLATTSAGALLATVPWANSRLTRRGATVPGLAIVISSLVVALVGMTVVLLTSGIDPVGWHALLLLPPLSLALVLARLIFAQAIGLSGTNDDACRALREALDELAILRQRHAVVQEREQRRLAILMHGPIQGRLAACVMALNFYANSARQDDDDARRAEILESVVKHLRDVSDDLVALAHLDLESATLTPEEGPD